MDGSEIYKLYQLIEILMPPVNFKNIVKFVMANPTEINIKILRRLLNTNRNYTLKDYPLGFSYSFGFGQLFRDFNVEELLFIFPEIIDIPNGIPKYSLFYTLNKFASSNGEGYGDGYKLAEKAKILLNIYENDPNLISNEIPGHGRPIYDFGKNKKRKSRCKTNKKSLHKKMQKKLKIY